MSATDKFEQWAILEIMGHQRYSGLVSEQALGGASFVRIDVPAVDGLPAFSKLFGAGSIYCISPCIVAWSWRFAPIAPTESRRGSAAAGCEERRCGDGSPPPL